MLRSAGDRMKTGRRDAVLLARVLAVGNAAWRNVFGVAALSRAGDEGGCLAAR